MVGKFSTSSGVKCTSGTSCVCVFSRTVLSSSLAIATWSFPGLSPFEEEACGSAALHRLGKWYTSRVHGSQNVIHPPSSRVMTQQCSTIFGCLESPDHSGSRMVPLQTYASFLMPSSTEQSRTAWSCTGPFPLQSMTCGSFQWSIFLWRRCLMLLSKGMQFIQWSSFVGMLYSSGVMILTRRDISGITVSRRLGSIIVARNRRKFAWSPELSSRGGLAPMLSGKGSAYCLAKSRFSLLNFFSWSFQNRLPMSSSSSLSDRTTFSIFPPG
mmetsp:Transcript_127385/g.360427  ORF Transcript_127385/g.360427 Transcript_127385/m.360427 type:complete len:269 (-) Transcript_127385:278-1084(-)